MSGKVPLIWWLLASNVLLNTTAMLASRWSFKLGTCVISLWLCCRCHRFGIDKSNTVVEHWSSLRLSGRLHASKHPFSHSAARPPHSLHCSKTLHHFMELPVEKCLRIILCFHVSVMVWPASCQHVQSKSQIGRNYNEHHVTSPMWSSSHLLLCLYWLLTRLVIVLLLCLVLLVSSRNLQGKGEEGRQFGQAERSGKSE